MSESLIANPACHDRYVRLVHADLTHPEATVIGRARRYWALRVRRYPDEGIDWSRHKTTGMRDTPYMSDPSRCRLERLTHCFLTFGEAAAVHAARARKAARMRKAALMRRNRDEWRAGILPDNFGSLTSDK